jgi:NAD(P)-dependent dehydrogenase (short-subunit alcohol dehydrogenase family)
MDLHLQGKRALVTGGSAGMGKAIVRQLAREGCDVALGARTESKLRQVADDIAQETSRKILPLVLDTLDGESIKTLVQRGSVEEKIAAVGSLMALRSVNVAPKITGRIERVLLQVGDRIKAGRAGAHCSMVAAASPTNSRILDCVDVIRR